MLINRENYENFFLLYADDELCAADKILVEKFAADNADLRQELEMLKAAVLPEESLIYSGTSGLYSNAVSHIHMQEKLLLLIDGELSAEDSRNLESLIKSDPIAKKEYEILLQAGLNAADHIIFTDKHLLYRKTNDNVIVGRFVRWAAAAILLGTGFFYGISLFNKMDTQNIAVNTEQPRMEQKENLSPVKVVPAETEVAKIPAPSGGKTIPVANIHASDIKGAGSEERAFENIARRNSKVQPEVSLVNSGVPGEIKKEDVATVPDVIPQKNSPVIASVNEPEKPPLPVNKEIPSSENKSADYTSSFTANLKTENRILYMDEDEVRRSKPFGFIRKIKKFVEHTAQLKPGNTLRIAGFEFKGG